MAHRIFFLILQICCSLELNSEMGFAKSEHKEKLLITNGVFPVEFNLKFTNQLINSEEATKLSKIGDMECNGLKIDKLINEINVQISDTFYSAFEPLVVDLKAKERTGRGIMVAAGIQLGLSVAEKLIGKSIDFLFDFRKRTTEHAVMDLQASLHTIRNDLKLSAVELCTLGKTVLEEKINRIAMELSLSIESQIKSEIQKLYFGELNNKYKLSACLALNEDASKYDCLKIIRSNDFTFKVIAIDILNEEAIIQLQILTPILSKIVIGHRIFNIGIPVIENENNFLVKGLIPDFITSQNELKFNTKLKFQVIEENFVMSKPKIDRDCFENNTHSDNMCDATIERTTANYIIKHINGYTILINFIQCSYTERDAIDEPKFLNMGTHIVQFNYGFLTCGEERLSFNHKSIHLRKHVAYSNYKIEFNFVEKELFNAYNKNILDQDHILSQVSVIPHISLRVIIICILILLVIFTATIFVLFYLKVKKIHRSISPPALVY